MDLLEVLSLVQILVSGHYGKNDVPHFKVMYNFIPCFRRSGYFLRGSSANLQRFKNVSRGYNRYSHSFKYGQRENILSDEVSQLKRQQSLHTQSRKGQYELAKLDSS